MKRPLFAGIALVVLALCLTPADSWAFMDRFRGKFKATKEEPKPGAQEQAQQAAASAGSLQERYDELKKKYDALDADRENILQQTKHLLTVKTELDQIRESRAGAQESAARLQKEKARLHVVNRKLKGELSNALEYYNQLETAYQELYPKHEELVNENAQLSLALVEKIDKSPEYRKLQKEADALREEVRSQAGRITQSEQKLKAHGEAAAKMKEHEKQLLTENQNQRDAVAALRAEKVELIKTRDDLTRQVNDMPKRFETMAKENQILLKETADMHYNLGVFFMENRNYERAVKEFTRALDFRPDSPKAHYNLGYIYSEALGRPEKAMGHFKRFLEIDPKSKEAEMVKGYLMTREIYGNRLEKAPTAGEIRLER